MYDNEGLETAKIGVVCIMFTLLLVIVAFINADTHSWFRHQRERAEISAYMNEKTETFIFDDASSVSGADILEFILKHDSKYDYYVKINTITYNLTLENAKNILKNTGGDMYSMSWLTENVFDTTGLYGEYTSSLIKTGDVVTGISFIKK